MRPKRRITKMLVSNLTLLAVLWSQLTMAVPQVHDEVDHGQFSAHAEVASHIMVLPDSEHQHEDGSEHELHVHACGGHVTAMPVSIELHSLSIPQELNAQPAQHFSIRSPERLLRPPTA
ncbi:MAG: hypothetical protein R3352_07710 [Salinisphaeraceae bacterium]|nr:hypothetical protein [Salinisphaeraceae bacterium]